MSHRREFAQGLKNDEIVCDDKIMQKWNFTSGFTRKFLRYYHEN